MGSSTGRPTPAPVFVITGTSGAGKGTLERLLLARMPDMFELAVSATTRERRPTEEHGREYYFLSEREFDRLLEDDEFLEYVELPWGARSGTLRSEIDRIQGQGKVPLLDLETDGAIRVKAARFLNQCRISQAKTVGGLSERQRAELIGLFSR